MGSSVSSHNFLVFNMHKYLAFQFFAQILGVISIKVVSPDEIASVHKQYAPKYPYTVDAASYHKHPVLSKFSWALSSKLVPPPVEESNAEDVDALYKHYYYTTEDNADMFYEPYLGANVEDVSMEDQADEFYKPYFHQTTGVQYYGGQPLQKPYMEVNVEDDSMEDQADEFYKPYFRQTTGVQYYGGQPLQKQDDELYQAPTQLQELPKLSHGALYEAPMMELSPGQRYQAPVMSVWENVDEADNEIYNMPKIFLKTINLKH